MSIRQAFPIARKAGGWFGLLVVLCPLLPAQRFLKLPTTEVFGGYSYLRFESKPFGFSDQLGLNGWNAELSLPTLYRGLGFTADISGHYSREIHEYNFMIGPRYTYEWSAFRFYGHGLFGRARTRFQVPGTSQFEPSNLGRAIAFGGGIDVPMGERFAVRLAQADYLVTSNFGQTQHHLRFSTGLVFRFGVKHENTP